MSQGPTSLSQQRSPLTRAWHLAAKPLPDSIRHKVRTAGQMIHTRHLRAHHGLILAYPKSGSTWLRNMAATLVADHEVAPNEVDRWIPALASIGSSPAQIFVSHNSPATPGIRRAGRIVTLVRDPRAVAVSYSFHRRRRGDGGFDPRAAAEQLIGSGILSIGSWQQHASSAIEASESGKALLVRYEDLATATEVTLRTILEYLGVPTTTSAIERTVAMNTVEELRRRRIEAGVDLAGEPIEGVRRGDPNSWRDECPDDVQALIVDAAGSAMRRLEYLD